MKKRAMKQKILFLFVFFTFSYQILVADSFINIKLDGYVSKTNVIVREAPSIKSRAIGNAFIGTKVWIRKKTTEKEKFGKESDYWYFCINQSREKGWIHGSFINEGLFDFDQYIKELSSVSLFDQYEILEKGHWSTCSKTELRLYPSCANGGLFFINQIFFFSSATAGEPIGKINYMKDSVFKISSYSKENNQIIVLGHQILRSDNWNEKNQRKKITVVIHDNKPNSIKVDNRTYFNIKSF